MLSVRKVFILLKSICFNSRTEWKNFEATVVGAKQITVRNVVNDTIEKLDFRDRIIKMALGYNHLVVTTSSQCYVYR